MVPKQKDLLHFPDFKFSDGTSKPKFLLVLFHDIENEEIVYYTLPSSQSQYVPTHFDTETGCKQEKYKSGDFHAFCFHKNDVIGEKGFFFRKTTYCFFTRNFYTGKIQQQFEILDRLCDEPFWELMYCLMKSNDLPLKVVTKIETMVQSYYQKQL